MTVAYFTGFETGDASEITTLGSNASIQSTTVRSGGYALKTTANAAQAIVTICTGLASTSVAVRFAFRKSATANSSGFLLPQAAGGAANGAFLIVDGANVIKVRDRASVTTSGATTLSDNTWYVIDFVYNSINGGIIKVWLNGVLEISTTETGTGITVDQILLEGDTTADFYFDDIRADNASLVQIGDGRCIARQGIAGTPTNNAWTKNGAATAALCWSDTPFATATNCTSSTSGAAQTMNVGAFNAAGSASEGVDTIAGGDTINACKTAAIFKRATSGSPLIRRIIGGSPTNTAVTGATTDAYKDDGIWTTTVANLAAAEAGMQKAADANLTTVEDVWIMVDYSAAVLPATIPWFRPFSEPTRFAGRERGARHTAEFAASGETPWPYAQPAIDNRNTRWHQPLSLPARYLRDPDFWAQQAAGPIFAAAIQPTNDNKNVNWFAPLSLPARYLKDPDFWAQQAGAVFAAAIAPTNDSKNVRWHRPFSEPVRFRRDPGYSTALAASGETGWPFAQAFIVTETITLDKWFVSWPTPTRRLVPAPVGVFLDPINTSSPAVDGWQRAFSEPLRYPRDPRYAATLDASGEFRWPVIAAINDAANVRWHRPFAEPVRYPRDPRYAATLPVSGEYSWPAVGPVNDAKNVNWHRPFSEPVRFRRDPGYTATLASGEIGWPFAQVFVVAPTVTVDGWFVPWLTPTRRPQTVALGHLADVPNATPPPVTWYRALVDPVRYPRDLRFRATLAASGESSWPSVIPVNDAHIRWHRPFSEPQRFARDPRYTAALAASGEVSWPVITAILDAAHVRWHRPFDEPIRYSRDPRYAAVLVATGMVLWPVTFAGPTLFPVPRQTLGNRAGRVSLVLHLAPRDSTLVNRSGRTSTVNKRLN